MAHFTGEVMRRNYQPPRRQPSITEAIIQQRYQQYAREAERREVQQPKPEPELAIPQDAHAMNCPRTLNDAWPCTCYKQKDNTNVK